MRVSIITVAYNSGETIEDTIKSVLSQTYPDIEYIIKDGGSTDDTLKICRRYEPLFNGRMKIISESDGGIYDAMNKGIEAATGEVVGLLNSDDFFTSNDIVETIVRSFRENDIDACYGDVHFVSKDNLKHCVRYYSSRPFRRWMMRLGFMPAHPSFYVKREIYDKYGLFDTSYKIAADFDNVLRLIYVNRIKTKYLNKDFVTMRTGGASNANYKSRMQIMRDHLASLKKHGIYSNAFIMSFRYIYKIYEVAITPIAYKKALKKDSINENEFFFRSRKRSEKTKSAKKIFKTLIARKTRIV